MQPGSDGPRVGATIIGDGHEGAQRHGGLRGPRFAPPCRALTPARVPGDGGTPGAGGGQMICYVDLEHPELGPSMLSERPEATERKADLLTRKARFERLSGELCLLSHFTQVDRSLLDRLGVRAVVISGHYTVIDDYDPRDLAPLVEIIRETSVPLLGLCGGHQLIGLAFGAQAAPIGPLAPGEDDPKPDLAPGMRKEWGPCRVRITAQDPLFDGLEETAVVERRPYW